MALEKIFIDFNLRLNKYKVNGLESMHLDNIKNEIARYGIRIKGVGSVMLKTMPVKAVQAGTGSAHPDKAFPILYQSADKPL